MGEISKENPEKEVEVVWACDAKRRTLRRKEGDGNGSTRKKEELRPKRRWLDKVKDDINPFHSGYSRGCRLPFHSGYDCRRRQRTW